MRNNNNISVPLDPMYKSLILYACLHFTILYYIIYLWGAEATGLCGVCEAFGCFV